MYAEVIINSNAKDLNRIFDYIVPINMENTSKKICPQKCPQPVFCWKDCPQTMPHIVDHCRA